MLCIKLFGINQCKQNGSVTAAQGLIDLAGCRDFVLAVGPVLGR